MAEARSNAPAKMLHLISSDCHDFIVKEDVAFISPTIVTMMSGPAVANGECHLTRITSHLLIILVRYLHYKKTNPSATWLRGSPPPSFPVPSSLRVDASYAADFLGLVHIGPSTDHIRLISADGHEFIMQKEIALEAKSIRDVLSREEISEAVVPLGGACLSLISSDGCVFHCTQRVGRAQRADPYLSSLSEEDLGRSFDSRFIRLISIYLIYKNKYADGGIPEFAIPPGRHIFLYAAAKFLRC